MIKIDTDAWKPFRVVDLGFSVHHGQRLNKAQRIEGETPFITAGFENRGVTQYIGNDRPIYHKAITVDMFGNCFFQSEDCAGDDNVYFFVNDDVNDLLKLFISAGIGAMTFAKFDYARQFRQGDADNLEVMLPATPDGEPDWAYMESYMRNVMDREEIFAEHLASLTAEAVADGHVVDTSTWKAFRVGELFGIAKHKAYINPRSLEPSSDGAHIVSASMTDNGLSVDTYAIEELADAMIPSRVITWGKQSPLFAYQDEKTIPGQGVYFYEVPQLSVLQALFVCVCMQTYVGPRYNYQECLIGQKMDAEFIMLPATPDGDPDWAFMEAYMKSVMEREAMFADELDKLVM